MKLYIIVILYISAQFVPLTAGSPRIIDGTAAAPGQFPWAAAIYLTNPSGQHLCGGALITDQWILTAAQCVYGAQSFTVHLGSNTLISVDENRVIFSTSTSVVHPDYNQDTLENDIGLIQLPTSVALSDYIQTINLADDSFVYEDSAATVLGWGLTRNDATGISNILNYVEVSIISNTECQNVFGNQITSGMVCTVAESNQGICVGDTGGSLVANDNNDEPLHVAVASFMSKNGCDTTDPNGYTRTSVYYSWIYNVTSSS